MEVPKGPIRYERPRSGRPASVIAELAERLGATLVVVGRRGQNGVAALVLGSVSHELVHQSRVPVTVVSAEFAEASAFPA
jgi:nucleotide-binding universal stress UspA family protein